MQKSTRPKIHVCLGYFFLAPFVLCMALCFSWDGFAQEQVSPMATSEDPDTAAKQAADAAENIMGDPNDGTIEVRYDAEAIAPYRERRSNWSGLFGINLIRMKPSKYRSRLQGDTSSYGAMFGDSAALNLVQLTIGPKYNFSAGSFSAELLVGAGAVAGKLNDQTHAFNGESRNLDLQKYGLQFGLLFDNIFPDPYVAPYLSGQVFGFSYKERATGVETSGKTAPTSGYTFGALLLLDWLDPDAALRAQNSGIENTYLDIFLTQLNTSTSDADPRLETSFDIGFGLKVEY
jgi:hypothetical protein